MNVKWHLFSRNLEYLIAKKRKISNFTSLTNFPRTKRATISVSVHIIDFGEIVD